MAKGIYIGADFEETVEEFVSCNLNKLANYFEIVKSTITFDDTTGSGLMNGADTSIMSLRAANEPGLRPVFYSPKAGNMASIVFTAKKNCSVSIYADVAPYSALNKKNCLSVTIENSQGKLLNSGFTTFSSAYSGSVWTGTISEGDIITLDYTMAVAPATSGVEKCKVVIQVKEFVTANKENIARKVKAIYIGDASGKARRVRKAYIGDANGKARLFYSAAAKIYGASWDGSSSTKWTRTGDAAGFSDPNPYISGATTYGSPFDSIYPWSGMTRITDSEAGELVAIPKYYYKITQGSNGQGLSIQISGDTFEGSHISPAHADRGDGTGERDIVYVGRYHCVSGYKSATGSQPLASITRATARSGIHALGSTIWQYDFAMYWTIMMLYLVEFADWNGQSTIGYGCSPSGGKWNMGYTDSMPYHTGTTAASRSTYGGTQYRSIEGLWDNVCDWCDGIYFSGANIYCIKNPASFSDSSGGTQTGTRPTSTGIISAWNIPTAPGFEYALYPSAVGGTETTYVCDRCRYNSGSSMVLYCGGWYGQNQNNGPFLLDGYVNSVTAYASTGCRLMKLP